MDLCPICYEICPHSEAILLRSLKPVADAPIKDEAVGYYRKIVLAQARKLYITYALVANLVSSFPDETPLNPFKKMRKNATGRVVVFDRADPKKFVGVITKTYLMMR